MAKKSTKKSKTIKSTPIILKKHEELVKTFEKEGVNVVSVGDGEAAN